MEKNDDLKHYNEKEVQKSANTGKEVIVSFGMDNKKVTEEGEYIGDLIMELLGMKIPMPVLFIPKLKIKISGAECWWSFKNQNQSHDDISMMDGAITKTISEDSEEGRILKKELEKEEKRTHNAFNHMYS